MAVTVKKAVLWRRELENRPGTLAEALKPFAEAKANLHVVMGYVLPGERARAALEVYPVTGKKAEEAARAAGMEPMSSVSALLVEGDDQVGLGYQMSNALAAKRINMHFAVIQVVGKRFSGVFGFEDSADADAAAGLIKAVAAAAKKKAAPRKKAAAKVSRKAAPKKKAAARKKTGAKKKAAPKKAARKTAKKPAARARAGARKTAARKPARRAKRK
jgi:predicted amino acid-binding ACT domain protein